MLKFNLILQNHSFLHFQNLNTSYVKVQRIAEKNKEQKQLNLNTSYVKVQQMMYLILGLHKIDLNTSYVKVQL